jgi:DNA polymerase-3 subunit delta
VRGYRSYRDFLRQLSAGQLASGYIFAGPEGYLVDQAVTALRDALLTNDFEFLDSLPREEGGILVDEVLLPILSSRPERLIPIENANQEAQFNQARRGAESFDYASYQGRETDVEQILMAVRTPPFMARRRLVVVRDFDKYRKEPQEALLAELAKEVPSCRLVLTVAAPSPTLERLIEEKGCGRYVISVPAARADEAAELIDQWARQNHLEIAPDARLLLLEMCGESFGHLRSELEKIRTFLGPGPEPPIAGKSDCVMTREMVRDLAGQWREYQVSEFVDAVARRNRTLALTTLRRLADWNEEPVKIVGWLAGRFLRMLAYGFGDAQQWSKPEIALALRQLSRIDLKLKSGYPEKYYLLDSFVVQRVAPRKTA